MYLEHAHLAFLTTPDPDPYVNKQYLPAINNVLAKFKKFFFHYSTTTMVTNSEKETNLLINYQKKQEQDQTRGERKQEEDGISQRETDRQRTQKE